MSARAQAAKQAEEKCLVVTIHNCVGLAGLTEQGHGSSPSPALPACCPKVAIRYGDQVQKTITLKYTLLPIWNNPSFTFVVKDNQDTVLIELDDDSTGSLIGTVSVPLTNILKMNNQRTLYTLTTTKKTKAGNETKVDATCRIETKSKTAALGVQDGMSPMRVQGEQEPAVPVSAKGQTAVKWNSGIRKAGRVGAKFEERMPVMIFDDPENLGKEVAAKIVRLIEQRRAAKLPCVLGLPTGNTPISVYAELIRYYKEEGVDFSHVVTYNLDEYYPIKPTDMQSYRRFMDENFFNYVNIPLENIHVPDGTIPPNKVDEYCAEYEESIKRDGGLDIILLGIGRTGHIGFNEPGSSMSSTTRVVVLDEITRMDAASDFFGEDHVPQQALTMGVGTILSARELIVMAQGEGKAKVVKKTVEDEPSPSMVAAYLQKHPHVTLCIDTAASTELTMEKTPWVVHTDIDWADITLAKRAVIWLAQKVGKSILRLQLSDFQQHHLQLLVHQYNSADQLCQLVYDDLYKKILSNDRLPTGKKVVVFSPHPDDDVICMGGMLERLRRLGNDITVAYCTFGSLAVFDYNVERHLRFVYMNAGLLMGEEDDVPTHPEGKLTAGSNNEKPQETATPAAKKGRGKKTAEPAEVVMTSAEKEATQEHVKALRNHVFETLRVLRSKSLGEMDPPMIEKVKARIRASEATAAIQCLGLPAEKARFLNLPFYRTGEIKKNPITDVDVNIVHEFLNEVHPDIVFLAGDLSDPHGTHRQCYKAIQRALVKYVGIHFPNGEQPEEHSGNSRSIAEVGRKRSLQDVESTKKAKTEMPAVPYPDVFLYRGAWIEYPIDAADYLLPMTKRELHMKIQAIHKHESQKQSMPFPGPDPREFYERAEHRNTDTADMMNKLGLPEFYAVECFVNKKALELPSS